MSQPLINNCCKLATFQARVDQRKFRARNFCAPCASSAACKAFAVSCVLFQPLKSGNLHVFRHRRVEGLAETAIEDGNFVRRAAQQGPIQALVDLDELPMRITGSNGWASQGLLAPAGTTGAVIDWLAIASLPIKPASARMR